MPLESPGGDVIDVDEKDVRRVDGGDSVSESSSPLSRFIIRIDSSRFICSFRRLVAFRKGFVRTSDFIAKLDVGDFGGTEMVTALCVS